MAQNHPDYSFEQLFQYLDEAARRGGSTSPSSLRQNAFLALWSRLGSSIDLRESGGDLRALASMTIRHQKIDGHRREGAAKRSKHKTEYLEEQYPEAPDTPPDRRAELNETFTRLENSISTVLSPRQALIIHFLFVHDFTLEETAEAAGVSLATVKRDYGKALIRLRAALEGHA